MALVAAAGLSVLITTIPEIAIAMKVAGSVYLLYLGVPDRGARALAQTEVARPLVSSRQPLPGHQSQSLDLCPRGGDDVAVRTGFDTVSGARLVAITMMLVVIPTAALWAGGRGGSVSPVAGRSHASESSSLGLGALLAATVVSVWI